MKVKVLFGKSATDYMNWEDHSLEETIDAIGKGVIDGMYCEYELDTEHDAKILRQAIDDMYGWEGYEVIDEL